MGAARNFGCKIDGCDGAHRALGLCHAHYARLKRYGNPQANPHGVGIPRVSDLRKPGRKGARIEDAIKVHSSIAGTITLEEWRRRRAMPAADIHVVKPMPRGGGFGDVA